MIRQKTPLPHSFDPANWFTVCDFGTYRAAGNP